MSTADFPFPLETIYSMKEIFLQGMDRLVKPGNWDCYRPWFVAYATSRSRGRKVVGPPGAALYAGLTALTTRSTITFSRDLESFGYPSLV